MRLPRFGRTSMVWPLASAIALGLPVAVTQTHARASGQVAAQSAPVPPDPVATPRVSIWYRGDPAGVPNADDLAELRALGFTAVTWPAGQPKGEMALQRMAAQIGLKVEIRGPGQRLTAATSLMPAARVDVPAGTGDAGALPALTWRAIAHGARTIAFDAGERAGQGWRDQAGAIRPWLADARLVARQFEFNADLIAALGRSLAVLHDGVRPEGVEILLIDANRSWVIVATNISSTRARGTVRFPRGTPPAPWANLFDGEVMAMLDQPDGARWTFELAPGSALVYAIDKR